MDDRTRWLIAGGAMVAPALHSVTDIMEWVQGGFSTPQLWLNYLAFLPLPAVLLGLCAVQGSRLPRSALFGALLYGAAFIYFAHTTLYALATGVREYAALWDQLGAFYTFNGGLMVVGGLLFGIGTLRAGVFPRWTASLFLLGLLVNLVLVVLPVPDILQTLGSAVRNAGLVGMGWCASRPEGT